MLLPCFPTSSFESFPLEPLPALEQTCLSLDQMESCCYCLRLDRDACILDIREASLKETGTRMKKITYEWLINNSCRLQSIVGAFKMFASSIGPAE